MERCHVFVVSEIELDIDTRKVISQAGLNTVVVFMARVGKVMEETIVPTEENRADVVQLRYDPRSDEVTFAGA